MTTSAANCMSGADELSFERISTWHPDFVAAIREHYTGSRAAPPGKKMAWRITDTVETIAWIGLGEPAYKLAPRRRLGLKDARPAALTVCCFIYRRVAAGITKVRGGDLLSMWHGVASEAWSERYGWEPVHWESLVQASAVESDVPGACFRSAGYRSLGLTTGRGARRPAGSTHSARVWGNTEPKLVFYRGPLHRVAV